VVHMLNNGLAVAPELLALSGPAVLDVMTIEELRRYWWMGPTFTGAALLAGVLLFQRWYPRRPWVLPRLRQVTPAVHDQPAMET
jgi:hypothetical protein